MEGEPAGPQAGHGCRVGVDVGPVQLGQGHLPALAEHPDRAVRRGQHDVPGVGVGIRIVAVEVGEATTERFDDGDRVIGPDTVSEAKSTPRTSVLHENLGAVTVEWAKLKSPWAPVIVSEFSAYPARRNSSA